MDAVGLASWLRRLLAFVEAIPRREIGLIHDPSLLFAIAY
jgi:hypothetical protein